MDLHGQYMILEALSHSCIMKSCSTYIMYINYVRAILGLAENQVPQNPMGLIIASTTFLMNMLDHLGVSWYPRINPPSVGNLYSTC